MVILKEAMEFKVVLKEAMEIYEERCKIIIKIVVLKRDHGDL
jgi:hypothetical protein